MPRRPLGAGSAMIASSGGWYGVPGSSSNRSGRAGFGGDFQARRRQNWVAERIDGQ